LAAAHDPPPACVQVLRSAQDPGTVLIVIAGRINRSDAADLGARVHAILDARLATRVVCDVAAADPDAAIVDCLCRVQLAARRHGCRLEIRAAPVALQELLCLIGLTDVLPSRRSREGRA
jgi:ABC-type transporter Mla MlaB component